MALGDVGGKVAVLRTFRVLRALKTVAVVPDKVSFYLDRFPLSISQSV